MDEQRTTISRAINNPGNVKKGTLEKIHNAMEGMNKKSNIIAFETPDLANTFFPMLLKGIESISRMQGYSVVVCNSEGISVNEDEILSSSLLQLTTIRQPFEEMGRTAAMKLLAIIKDPDVTVNSCCLSNGLVIRKSCQYLKKR